MYDMRNIFIISYHLFTIDHNETKMHFFVLFGLHASFVSTITVDVTWVKFIIKHKNTLHACSLSIVLQTFKTLSFQLNRSFC